MAAEKGRVVCVTGAGGFVGSWLVKHLLSRNYTVHGTVRNPQDEKNAHLKRLENASGNLKLFKADLLDYKSLTAAIAGCNGVFHTASPVPSGSVPNPEVELIEPAVKGTLNVLKACCEVNVKNVVFVSSVAAIALLPNRPTDRPMDETFWSDLEFCRSNNVITEPNHQTGLVLSLSKTQAESEAFEFSKTNGINFSSVCPTLIIGPMLQNTINASSLVLLKLLKEGYEELEKKLCMIVDARDLAEGLILVYEKGADLYTTIFLRTQQFKFYSVVQYNPIMHQLLCMEKKELCTNQLSYEKPEANGRYICTSHDIRSKELVEILKKLHPKYKYPKKFTDSNGIFSITSEKLQRLGWSYRPLEETLVDSVESYKESGILGDE